jgi:hypothetical protein
VVRSSVARTEIDAQEKPAPEAANGAAKRARHC